MGSAVILPKKLGYKLRDKAEETGYLPEELGVELISQGLNEELDPEDFVEQYRALSEKYLAEAKELLKKGDLVQASEKFWGAAALTVKMLAAKRGQTLEQHGALWAFVSRVARATGDKAIISSFSEANSLHKNFYENELTREVVEKMAEDVEQLIVKLKGGDDNGTSIEV